MSHAILTAPLTPASPCALPAPRVPVQVRAATPADLPFIDGLQKLHTHMVGWMPTKQIEGKIAAGHVIVAEESVVSGQLSVVQDGNTGSPATDNGPRTTDTRLGCCIGHDQYFKRDDVGIIYQMNVVPGRQRGFVGATLLKAMFDRAAYGCRLFCCWCAQDIEANRFWESMGFVPLAFRAGSRGKRRVHIFWQRRIRRGDTTTPYWFPSQTTSGAIREDRLVLPIPPGTHWSEAKPIVLPGEPNDEPKRLPSPKRRTSKDVPKINPRSISLGGLRLAPPRPPEPEPKPKPEPKRKVKNDPKLVAAARELRDRWLERVNEEGFALPAGKYDVSRAIEGTAVDPPGAMLLPGSPRPAAPALPAPAAA